jgi:DNA mismatch repair protein PMS2
VRMASIKAIEAKSVHQIQSGQVIVDLCSVVKELVENSLDAEATNIEVRFKNNGLDLIEVQDNGSGISPSNYPSVALKHHTSKLSTYDDLSSLDTFGFRGEALSSLCALSKFSVTTAQADEAPKGTRLEFNLSGALQNTSTVASQKGTTATVENLFEKLPVRRKELAKNIKREYGKVLSLLHAYACIGVNVKFIVKNAMPKGKSTVIFSTKGNPTTRDNIANVYGAKTLQALVPLDLSMTFEPSRTQLNSDGHDSIVSLAGHISKPVFGEGRQTPDRQMFFVNGRPCGLPQIAKAINEVYRSFNVSQSPFIFANFIMDTNAYDVNVSPDKRTILLHNAVNLVETLKTSLTEMFEKEDQTLPQSQLRSTKLPAFKQLSVQRQQSADTDPRMDSPTRRDSGDSRLTDDDAALVSANHDNDAAPSRLLHHHFQNQASTRDEQQEERDREKHEAKLRKAHEKHAEKVAKAVAEEEQRRQGMDEYDDVREMAAEASQGDGEAPLPSPHAIRVRDFNARMAEQQAAKPPETDDEQEDTRKSATTPVAEDEVRGVVQNAFDRMRPKRLPAQLATIEIEGETTTTMIGTQIPSFSNQSRTRNTNAPYKQHSPNLSIFSQRLQRFGAPGAAPLSITNGAEPDDREDIETKVELMDQDTVDQSDTSESESSDEGDILADGQFETHTARNNVEEAEEEDGMESDADYIDEEEKKAQEEARVEELIRAAEESASMPSKENLQRANKALKGSSAKDSTTNFLATVDISLENLQSQMQNTREALIRSSDDQNANQQDESLIQDEETHLSLTVSKSDFASMEIIGQFNLGFILATRPAESDGARKGHAKDELFIIDQHASDEKFNFERLQAETVVGNQRMVQAVNLNLTAVEEEIVLDNVIALEKNGFLVHVDTSGDTPVGRRVTLLTLPLSKELVFDTRDLDELIALLSETPMLTPDSAPPRPSRVRKMFAMRACRSSIMIGKTLSKRQMKKVVENMGSMEKPWNCPHGRPTMRHLTSLNDIHSWNEGDDEEGPQDMASLWRDYLAS